MKLTKLTPLIFAFCILHFAFFSGAARAVVLQQQWQAGQQLSYDTALDGTLDLRIPKASSSLFAGIPIQVKMRGDGQTTLDTLNVDEFGSGTVAVRLDYLQVKAEGLGQVAKLSFQNGQADLSLNGQPVEGVNDADWSVLQNPPAALRLSKQMRLEGLAPLGEPKPDAAEDESDKAKSAPKKMSLPLDIFNMPLLVQSLIARSLPALWPAQDVKAGDTWSAVVAPPSSDATSTPAASTPDTTGEAKSPLGKFDFALQGEEEIQGRKVQHITVDGAFQLSDEETSAVIEKVGELKNADEKSKAGKANKAGARALSGRQQVKGDLWFDAAAGQLVRADLQLQTRAQSKLKNAGKPRDDGSLNIDGTLKMQLRKVSYAGNGA